VLAAKFPHPVRRFLAKDNDSSRLCNIVKRSFLKYFLNAVIAPIAITAFLHRLRCLETHYQLTSKSETLALFIKHLPP